MANHYKKKQGKRYKIKPVPVIIALIILILIVFLIGTLMKGWLKPAEDNGDVLPSSTPVSEDAASLPSSDEVSSEPPVSTVGGDPNSSENSIQEQVSKPTSQATSSKPASSDTSSDTPSKPPATSVPTPPSDGSRPAGSKSDWNLILLNNDNVITKDLDIEKTKFDTQWVDSRAAQAYKDMYKAAAEKGITLYLRSGYRSRATQQRNYDNEVARYMGLGNSKEEAIKLTNRFYALPGSSEHHSGLAFDIITPEYHNNIYTLNEQFAKTDAYKWLLEHSTEFGFALRFPKDKQELTGINFEPWHYRYVGVEHANYMKEHNLCLEEYISMFDE